MRREWTEWEVRYLEKKYVGQPVEKTAKKLNRTINSVKRKAAKLDLNHYTDSLSAKVVARCFGSDVSVVIRWINKFDLPCKKVICGNQTRYLIETKNFGNGQRIIRISSIGVNMKDNHCFQNRIG